MKRIVFFLVIVSTALFSSVLSAQTKKTFRDNNFVKGDIIRAPNIEVEVLNREIDIYNDSLDMIANFLLAHPHLRLELACHTDSRGNLEGNLKASQYRAQGIRDYLINNKNVNPDRLTAKGYGEKKLIVSDQTIANAKTKEEKEKLHLINRRIELIVQ